MSDDDLIRRGDALTEIRRIFGGLPNWVADAIAALPAVTVRVQETAIHRAVLDWIRDDTGTAVKMSITPDQANALTARILAAILALIQKGDTDDR